jgi:hypothetical protein
MTRSTEENLYEQEPIPATHLFWQTNFLTANYFPEL